MFLSEIVVISRLLTLTTFTAIFVLLYYQVNYIAIIVVFGVFLITLLIVISEVFHKLYTEYQLSLMTH